MTVTDLYREPRLTTAEVSAALSVTLRQAQQLVSRHPEASKDLRWTIPTRCLPDLERRPKRGRPRKTIGRSDTELRR